MQATMKKFFNRLGANEEGKGKKASGRASDGLVRASDVPAFNQSPLLLRGGPAENGNPERDASDTPPNRPVPSFITNSVNLPTYGQSGAVPLPLPSEPLALPLPEPSSPPPSFAPNSQGNPHCLPTEDSLSPGGFGFANQAPTQGDGSEVGKGVSTKGGLTISRTGPNNPGFSSPRPHPSPGAQKGLSSVFKTTGRSNQGPLPFNFPNQRPSPLETVLSGPKRGQISKPIADATVSEPSASPQLASELTTPSPNLTPRSAPEWTSSVPPVSPFWPRTSPGSANPHHNKLRRSPSLNSNPDSSSDLSNTSSPLSRFSPVGQANQGTNPHSGLAKNGKSAPSSPAARSEGLASGKPDAFGSGNSVGSAVSEPPLSTDSAELDTVQSETSEQEDNVGPLLSPGLDERREGVRPVLARKLLGLEDGADDTSEEGSSAGGSESTESSAAGAWLNAGHSPNRAANHPPRVHFDLNEGKVGVPSSLRGGLLSPKAAHVLGLGDDSSPDLSPQAMLDAPEAPRHPEGWKKEVGEEDLTQSITPRTAEALQGEVGRQKRTPKKSEGSQAGSAVSLGGRSPQKTAGAAASRLQRPVNTHLNVPKQLTPITAGPAWHESIAGLPGASSERPSSALQAHPLPDIDQAYTPPSSTPSPKDGASLPPTSASSVRSSGRAFPNRNIPSPEHLPHHMRATSAPTKSNDNISPNSGKPIRLSEVGGSRNAQNETGLEGGSRAKVTRGQSEPIARGLMPESGYLPKADVHHLPLSEATRTLSDPILPRIGQRRTSMDQDATPLPLPLPPMEQKPGKGVSPAQTPISPAQPSPLPALPPTGYPITQTILPVNKASNLVSPSQLIAARSLSPHPSPSSVLQQGDRNSKDYRKGNVDAAHPGPKMPLNWRKGNELGRGTFGSVYRGLNIDNGEMFAVKEVGEAQQNVRDESMSQLEHEISLLSKLKHPNIVQYIGTKREEGNLYIFLEYMSGGSIESLLRSYDFFEEPLIRFYTKQILCGLKYLHDQSTIHRDIKGANILVDNRGRVALADFGMAKQICEAQSLTKSGIKGSAFWMAPEVVRHEPGDGRPADIWSVGCTVLEMAVGVPPWSKECNNLIAVLYKIASCKDYPHIPEHLSETAVDFVKLCLNRSPEERPKVDDLLKHPFIADMAPEMSDVLSPGTPSPRPVAPVIPRNLHRTSQTPANSRLVRQTSGRLREAIEEEESVSATVAALVDAPSPRASGSKGLGGVGSNSGKNLGGGPKSRPQTPPPNWSPSGDEPKPGPSLGARLRSQDLRGNAQEPKGTESQLKPRLRWKSPSSTQSNALSGDDAARSVEDSFRFGDPRIETRSPLPLTRHKSADAPTRRPLRTLLEDGPDYVGRLHKGVSVPLEVSRRKSTLEKGGEIDMFHTSKQMGLIER